MPSNSSISSFKETRGKSFRIFWIKLFLISLPLIGLMGSSFSVLFFSGELMPMRQVFKKQNDPAKITLLGLAYSELDFYYKLHGYFSKGVQGTDVMALGTSRVLPIRAEFFSSASFYNAGRGIAKIKHMRSFLKNIPEAKTPKILVLGLDQNFFNRSWDNLKEDHAEKRFFQAPDSFSVFANSWTIIYKDFLKKKFVLSDFLRPERGARIGLNALVNDEGYRNDGSYRYGKFLKNPDDPSFVDHGYQNTFKNIEKGIDRFEFNDEVSPEAVRELSLFLNDCKARGIRVIGFLPPYAHAIYEKLKTTGKHSYLFALPGVLQPLFKQNGYEFYDFSDLGTLGMSDRETTDGFHANEKAYLKILLTMGKANPELGRHMAVEDLEQKLAAADERRAVFLT